MTDEQILNNDISDEDKNKITKDYLKLINDNKIVKELF